MKKRIIILAIVTAAVLTGFSVYHSTTDLKVTLVKSWENHTDADEVYRTQFLALVSALSDNSPEIRTKLDSYKTKLEIAEDEQLFNMIFLMRRLVDANSFYSGLDNWNRMADATKAKIIPHFGPTYKEVTSATVADNKHFAELLDQRHSDRAAVLAGIPVSFQEVIGVLDASEVDGYLDTLHALMVNTMKVMEYLGQKDEPKDEL